MAASPDYLRQLMIDRGLPQHIAEGFLMNFGDESGFNPGINEIAPTVPGSRGGYGLYQLTGPRRRAYEAYAGNRGASLDDPAAQIDFMMQELQGPESRAAASIFASKSPQEAAVAIARDFLRPAPENLQKRVAKYGGASSSVSTGATNGAMPMGLLNMPQEPQSFGDRIKAGFQSGEMFDKLAIAFNSLRLNPDEGLGQMIEAKQNRKAEDQKTNRTAAWLEASGRPDLAQAVASGALGGREAVGLFYQPKEDTRLQELQIQKAQFELGQLQAGIGQDPDVQSSQALPDQSGVVMTMRDGSVKVKTVGGNTLEGQAALDFVRKSQETNAEYQRRIYGAREGGKLEAQIDKGGDAARVIEEGKLAPGIAQDFFKRSENVSSSIRNMDSAIAAIDDGAQSGIVYDMLPNITVASADLQNARNRLGLDVIGSITFGALSEGEMNLAMDTAVPKGLPPDQLRIWLERKREAQQKMLVALQDAALHFASGGTQEEYYNRIGMTGGTLSPSGKSDTPPQGGQGAAPAPGGTVRKKFNPQTGAFE